MKEANVLLQITSGKGPHECTWVAAQVLRELIHDANENGINHKVITKINGHCANTIESVILSLCGCQLDQFIDTWTGTIQWIGTSPYRKMHKRKNWFIAVHKIDVSNHDKWLETDVSYQTMRSSGAGGQHVNKTNSCVRAIHVPTGLTVTAMDTRSQHQNKRLAYERLKSKFDDQMGNRMKHQIETIWLNQMKIERGNAIRTYVGEKFTLKI
jgi:peptide chain release factor